MKLLLDSRSPGDACLRSMIQETWTARLMQLQDSVSQAVCHMLNARDALCQSVPHAAECLSADEHLSQAGKIEEECACCGQQMRHSNEIEHGEVSLASYLQQLRPSDAHHIEDCLAEMLNK